MVNRSDIENFWTRGDVHSRVHQAMSDAGLNNKKLEVEDLFPGCVGQDPNKKVSNLIEEKGDYRKLKLLPNAKLQSFALIPKSSHFNVIENPKGCANAVYDFIKNI